MTRPAFAVVHGRFQPFHCEHLAYCQLGLERGDTLVVGITNFDPALGRAEPTNPQRHLAAANPFTYWERALMVRDALLGAGVPPERFVVVAFAIHHPKHWLHYLPCDPADSLHVIRVFSAWEAEKARRLQGAGLRVETVTSGAKRISASEVRARMVVGDGWQPLVPGAVRDWIMRLDGVRRLREMSPEVLPTSARAPDTEGDGRGTRPTDDDDENAAGSERGQARTAS